MKKAIVGVAVWAWVALSFLCGGCATVPTSPAVFPRQDEAALIVWHTYGRRDKPPRINWVHVELDKGCTQKTSRDIGFRTIYGECVGGVTYEPYAVYTVEPVGRTYSETALAHEFQHAARMRDGRADCATHDAEFYKMVGLANAQLDAAGM